LIALNTTTSTSPARLLTSKPAECSEILWLSDETIAYLNDTGLYSTSIRGLPPRAHLLDFPAGINPSSLKYEPKNGILAFTGMVWEDGSFENVARRDKAYSERGDTGMVYDDLFIR